METLITALDGALAFAPLWLRLCLLGVPVGAIAMGLYGKLSPQDKLNALNEELVQARKEMNSYDGTDPKVVMALSRKSVGLALKQVGMMLPSTLVAAAPVIAILYGLDAVYAGRTVLGGVPAWASGWEPTFLVAMSVGAIVVKLVFKIR